MIPKWLSLVLLIYGKMTATYARSTSRAELLFCFVSFHGKWLRQFDCFGDQVEITAGYQGTAVGFSLIRI